MRKYEIDIKKICSSKELNNNERLNIGKYDGKIIRVIGRGGDCDVVGILEYTPLTAKGLGLSWINCKVFGRDKDLGINTQALMNGYEYKVSIVETKHNILYKINNG